MLRFTLRTGLGAADISIVIAALSCAVAEVELVKGPAVIRHLFLDPSACNILVTLQVTLLHLPSAYCFPSLSDLVGKLRPQGTTPVLLLLLPSFVSGVRCVS